MFDFFSLIPFHAFPELQGKVDDFQTINTYNAMRSVGGKEVLQSHLADTVSEGNLDKTQLRVSKTKLRHYDENYFWYY